MAPAIAEFVAEIDLDNCVLQLPHGVGSAIFLELCRRRDTRGN